MIIGFSHLTYNSIEPEKAISALQKKGYIDRFTEIGLENSIEKKPLLNYYSAKHNLHFMTHDDAYDIEVVDHMMKKNPVKQNRISYGSRLQIKCLKSQLKSEEAFWLSLGFKKNNNTLQIYRPIKSWTLSFDLLESTDSLCEQKLDINGITSIAFIVNKMDVFLATIDFLWASQPFNLQVNNKSLNIILLKSPSGLIIELIEVVK